MEKSRKVLIVTDDDVSSQSMAKSIADIIASPLFDGYSVSVIKSETFYGTDILPSYAFFIGCETPSPLTFTYVEILFERINLAGRPCGVFSSNAKALRYLSGMVSTSEASLGKPMLAKNGEVDDAKLREWLKGILENGEKR